MASGSESPGNKTGAKSAKAIKAATKRKKVAGAKGKGLPKSREIPWMLIGAVTVIVALVGLLAWNLIPKYQERADADKYAPSETNKDPSTGIDGVKVEPYKAGLHITAPQRVAYNQTPPFGGPHDNAWATCTGVVYPTAIRTENAVHSLEHGTVWITYNPDEVSGDALDELASRVDNKPYMMMSPYPGQDSPISLQAWGHQLKLDNADDRRIPQFIAALRANSYNAPEPNGSCATIPDAFDPDNPPPFDPSPPGPDAVPFDGAGLTPDATETGGQPGLPQLPPGMELPPELQNQLPPDIQNQLPPAPAPAPAP
ncbi:DUF3105 domain-containing protein [Antrihabitans spumae]|jgi:hypothetical protein|uniref:DUF3105 domain-containing protein n=1 Tax=Antrihabitans spumae TaxID=3373370 RepID=A0ABW7KAK9_9NOCA